MQLSALARDFTLGDGVSKDGVTSEAPQTVLVSLTPPEKEVDDVATTTTGKIKFEITQPLICKISESSPGYQPFKTLYIYE
jgi:hypothetical protein